MHPAADRVLALDRALEDIRFADLLLREALGVPNWRGPASDAFGAAGEELARLLQASAAALERERGRTLLQVWME